MRGIKITITLLGLITGLQGYAQVNGGQFAMEFLRMSNSPHVTAMGGISPANPDDDISLVMQNPSLMRPGLHNQLGLNYNSYYGDIKVMNLQYGYNAPQINTSFFLGVQYLNYGTFNQTDVLGNNYGQFKAADFALTLGASRKYGEHWRYGSAIKIARSHLSDYSATAVLMDVGVNYYDTTNLWDIGIVAKNMGAMAIKYNTELPAEPLPFDLQLGISKRFKHMPLRIFTTVHHLYEWDIRYNNPADNVTTNILGITDSSKLTGNYYADKFFRHFIFGAELALGKKLLLTASYNYLRRQELMISTKAGTTGFAFGASVDLNKFQVRYGRSYYHITGAYNELAINFKLNKLVHLGHPGDKLKWNSEYPDWD